MEPLVHIDPDRRAALLADPPTNRPVDVILDTDVTNEVDDQFALVWAALRPDRLRLLGLTACPYAFGVDRLLAPGMFPEVDARRIRAALDEDPTGGGRVRTLDAAEGQRLAHEELVRFSDLAGLDHDLVVPGADRMLADEVSPVLSPASDRIIRLAHEERDGPLYVLGIGAATNIASALLADPSITSRIVVVWTSAYPSFWPHPNASFNMAQDVHASRVLFDSGVPLVYLPGYYVGERLLTVPEEIEQHCRGAGPLGAYLAETFTADSLTLGPPGTSKVIWDLVNVAWLVEPSWLVLHDVATPVLDEELRWAPRPHAPLMREAVSIDRDAVFRDLFARLAR